MAKFLLRYVQPHIPTVDTRLNKPLLKYKEHFFKYQILERKKVKIYKMRIKKIIKKLNKGLEIFRVTMRSYII